MTAWNSLARNHWTQDREELRAEPGVRLSKATVQALIAGALAITLISLLVTPSITFDPESWIVWARALTGPLPFDTHYGPSWHPLPVFLIIPFTLITHGGADVYYWLAVSRFGSMLAVVGAFGLGTRLAGWWAGALAAILVVLSPWWLYYGTVGTGETMAAGLALCAVWAEFEGRPKLAAVLALGVALLRPEAWPFVFPYLLWLAYRRALPRWTFPVALVGTLLAWAVPNLLGAGQGAAKAAMAAPVLADGVHARIPFIRVGEIAVSRLSVIPTILVVLGILLAAWALLWRQRRALLKSKPRALVGARGRALVETALGPMGMLELALIVIGVGWVLVVALETQILRFPGNARYLEPGLAMLLVVAAVTAVRLGSHIRPLLAPLVLATVCLTAITSIGFMHRNVYQINRRTNLVTQMKRELAQLHCPSGRVWTRYRVAWLAVLTGETNQQALRLRRFPDPPKGHLLSCAPPNAPPAR